MLSQLRPNCCSGLAVGILQQLLTHHGLGAQTLILPKHLKLGYPDKSLRPAIVNQLCCERSAGVVQGGGVSSRVSSFITQEGSTGEGTYLCVQLEVVGMVFHGLFLKRTPHPTKSTKVSNCKALLCRMAKTRICLQIFQAKGSSVHVQKGGVHVEKGPMRTLPWAPSNLEPDLDDIN